MVKSLNTFNKNFNLMILGQIISLFGASILKFALSLYILDITGKAEIFATILAVSSIPIIIFSPIGGAIADIFNRRNLMVIFDFSSSITVLVLALFLFNNNGSILLVGIIMTILSVISTMYQPTVQSSTPLLVDNEHLMNANGIVAGVASLTNIAGPVLGGVLYGVIGINAIIAISCVSFFLSAIMEIFIQIPFIKQEQTSNIIKTIFTDIRDGIVHICKKNRFILKILFLAIAINLFLSSMLIVGIPYIVKITIGASNFLYGLAEGAISFSSLVAAVSIGIFSKYLKITNLHIPFIICALVFIPMAFSVYPFILNTGFPVPFLIFIVSSMLIFFTTTLISIYVITVTQLKTPNELLGKVMSILFSGTAIAMPLGQVMYGKLFDLLSDRVYIIILGVGFITLLIAFVSKITLRNEKL
ncbi:TPA: MFS transporter [Clostridioides difficile]|uniref:MFS transporter n=1 Tax=Clostridioides difficile TaxID=1496 RepID=UPI0010B41AD6|nr:MFS transporter [Clostridioides difficile]MBY2436769.1 MFS transporter [Clostridioides difficile]TQX29297.1 MFS transporter [Clostridioides difficile]VIB51913.1 transporter, Major Facilitator Superfamily (MFS) [Clostridioides difficile]HBF6357567.1 MFS transporter [Clostridioides difficile]HBG5847066.1 MFS transporter [Clostridioides difficile]